MPDLYLSDDVYAALEKYAKAEKDRMDNPTIKRMITAKSVAQMILRNELQRRGYLKPSGALK